MRYFLSVLLLTGVPLLAADPPKAEAPKAPPQTDLKQPAVPSNLADWTPRPAQGKVEAWEKMTDKDWIDPRFQQMDTGPTLHATFRYPVGKVGELVYKGLSLKLGSGGILFDRNTMQLSAVWTGGYLLHSDRRFGLLNTPTPVGTLLAASPPAPGWTDPRPAGSPPPPARTAPLPREWARYRGHYRTSQGITLAYTVGASDVLEIYTIAQQEQRSRIDRHIRQQSPNQKTPAVKVQTYGDALLPAGQVDWNQATAPAPRQWGNPIITKLIRGDDTGPLAVDTLTIPHENPFKSLFFCTGVDFLPDGQIAMCTCHGDVWLVRVDEAKNTCTWQRYATGLFHPLGLKVVDGKVFVLESGQLTRLHDLNQDGEADFYENFNNDWHTGPGEHAYDTCLETDPQGNFFFFKTGDTNLPNGGCLMKVSRDGQKTELYATGFRHPIGMGMSSSGVITGADQEGNWMPATRVDQYKPGGFYGDMRGHHRRIPPTTYDLPLCWLPREVDNSAGGQVWVPPNQFGPLAGLPLHLSYGRCKPFVLLRQEVGDVTQAAVWDLGIRFLSGSCRARFAPDGAMYVCGLNGWQTAAKADGSLQRVRATGKPIHAPVQMKATTTGFDITFARKLDKSSVEDPARYRSAKWNYIWSGDYGSKRYSPSKPGVVGQDEASISQAKLLDDGRTIRLTMPGMAPVMQQQLGLNIQAADGTPIVGSLYLTIHKLAP